MSSLKGRDFLGIEGLSQDEIYRLIAKSMEIKFYPQKAGRPLEGGCVALIFHKPSMRTRVSFEAAVAALGGHPIFLRQEEVGLGERESIADLARVITRYVDAIVIRTFAQSIAAELADFASVPVINALTDEEHPCQAIADLMTIAEKKERLAGVKLAYIGDGGNNVARSLMLAGALTGMEIKIASPKGSEPDQAVVERARELSRGAGSKGAANAISVVNEPIEAARGADVIYTDVWVSMGQEAKRNEKIEAFKGFQVDERLMAAANPSAIFMHCLPAHRDEEVSSAVLDSKASVVFDQAENRLHTAKAILSSLVGG